MAKGWRRESKRHSLAARGIETHRQQDLSARMNSRATEMLCKYLNLSRAPDDMLLSLVTDPTAHEHARVLAFKELERREAKEHPSFTDKQVTQVVNDHIAKHKKSSEQEDGIVGRVSKLRASGLSDEQIRKKLAVESKRRESGHSNPGKFKIHTTEHYHRMRVIEPSTCKKGSFRTQTLGKGAKRVACRLKKSGGWKTQAVLVPKGASVGKSVV